MERPLRIRLLDRDLTVRVKPEDEALILAAAALANERLTAFRTEHPAQPELTATLVVVMELAQELLAAREQRSEYDIRLSDALVGLDLELAAALIRDALPPEEQP